MKCALLIILILRDAAIQAVQVTGGNVTVVEGDTAVLSCLLTDSTESLTQITWQRRTRLLKLDTNFFTILSQTEPYYFNGPDDRFSFVGNFAAKNGSLQLSTVKLSDEGTYTCIYTLFPSGNYKTEIPLNVLVPPKVAIEDNVSFVGNEEVVLGSCTAAGSRPPAKVDWHLGNLSDVLIIRNKSVENTDGTTTTVSTISGVPSRDLHNRLVQCVVTSLASPGGTTLSLAFQIHFPPVEVNISERLKNSFECTSEANPKANITWSRPGGLWPDSVEVKDAMLQILKPTAQMNGLFQCKATNTYGTAQGLLYLHLSSEGTCTAGWTLFCLLLCANIAVAVMWFYRSDKKCALPWGTTRDDDTTGDLERPEELATVPLQEAENPDREI